LINKVIRDFVNLLLYGGLFIGLCAACITALSLELTGKTDQYLDYIYFIGAATAALYSAHRVIGLRKLEHIKSSERYDVIRQYETHIWIYCIIWIGVTLWLFIPLASLELILWLIPGGFIGAAYVIPFLSGKKRLRDLGWGKILMIGWSWGWLTAFIPLWHFADAPLQMAIVNGLERMLFIIVLTIPFEIRDFKVDQSVGLITMPEKLGRRKTYRITVLFCVLIILLSAVISFHYINPPYVIAMILSCIVLVPMIQYSYTIEDDFYFGGLIDGLMIFALVMYAGVNVFL
jgi:4-hydroxybenzoate polyprenyltransferase